MNPLQVADNIVVRTWQRGDAEKLFQAIQANRDHLSVWFSWPEFHTSVKATTAWIEDCGKGPIFKDRTECGIWLDGQLVGSFGFEKGNFENRSVGLGYWLAKDLTGNGLMTEVTKAACKYLFLSKRINRITIKAIESNTKSCAIPERLNFTFEGVERDGVLLRGRYYNVKVYSLLSYEIDLI